MTEFELTDFFKGIVDSEEGPIVICNMDYRIIYLNPSAMDYYKSGHNMQGKLLESFMNEELMSMVRMSVEWFKESRDNNRVFAFHDNKKNLDMYILAIRNGSGDLIGFYGREESRTPDQSRPFDLD